jgi:hypothetical protein
VRRKKTDWLLEFMEMIKLGCSSGKKENLYYENNENLAA